MDLHICSFLKIYKKKKHVFQNSIPFICNSEIESLDIDTEEDFLIAKAYKSFFKL